MSDHAAEVFLMVIVGVVMAIYIALILLAMFSAFMEPYQEQREYEEEKWRSEHEPNNAWVQPLRRDG